jgi:hypothetical protein
LAGAAPDTPVAQLLSETGVFDRTRSLAAQMVEKLQKDNPDIPAGVWQNFGSRVSDDAAIVSLYGPVYERHLSPADIDALVVFFRSPLGKRLTAGLIQVRADTQAMSQRWALAVAESLLMPDADIENLDLAVSDDALGPGSRTADIEELIRISGALEEAQSTSKRMLEGLSRSNVAGALMERARMRLADGRALSKSWIPAYAHIFGPSEIRQLTEFYRTPLGRRWAAALRPIRIESLAAAQKMSDALAQRVIRDALGPLPPWRLMHPLLPPSGVARGSSP